MKSLQAREIVMRQVSTVKVGQRIRFDRDLFEHAFPRLALVEERPPIDQFLEKMMGANYGAWTAHFDLFGKYYEIARHVPGNEIIRRDYDRRHIPLPKPPPSE